MTLDPTRSARQLALFGPPLASGLLSVTHPTALTTSDLAPQADWFITPHVPQLVLFGLIGIGVCLLIQGQRGPLAATSRAGLAVCVVFLDAWDAIAGIATGILIRDASLPADQQPVAFAMSDARFTDPLVGGASIGMFSALGGVGALVGPRGRAGLTFRSGHLPTVPLSMLFLVPTTAMLKFRTLRPVVPAPAARTMAATS